MACAARDAVTGGCDIYKIGGSGEKVAFLLTCWFADWVLGACGVGGIYDTHKSG